MYKYLFGPVPSRRLGKSLGVDIVAPKSCNMNCVFCECGATAKFIMKRDSFIDVDNLKKEIIESLKMIKPDCITFSGQGEPTLNKDIGKIINWIKEITDIKVVVITNSGLLSDKNLRNDLKNADIIIPTLNSINQKTFEKINRAAKEITIDKIKDGIKKLGEEFLGEIWIETFIIEGINDTFEEMEGLYNFLKNIKYKKLQLNRLDRMGAETWVLPARDERLYEIQKYLAKKGLNNVEVIGKFSIKEDDKIKVNSELVSNMEKKRKYSKTEIEAIYK